MRAWLLLLVIPAAFADGLGAPPSTGTAARDVAAAFALPPLHDAAGSDVVRQLDQLQVGRRARRLGIDAGSATRAWRDADATLARARARIDAAPRGRAAIFSGRRASELNALLRSSGANAVRVVAARLDVDETIVMRRAGQQLDLGRAELRARRGGPRFLVRIDGAADASVRGGAFTAGDWAVLVVRSRNVLLHGGSYRNLARGGVVVTDAPGTVVAGSRFTGIDGAAILVHGDTRGAAVLGNEIVANRGRSNWHAGIVVTDRNAAVASDPDAILQADRHGVREERIDSRLRVPRGNVFAGNRIALNASSGFYSDGGVENVVFDNLIEGNAKEGLCLDNGSSANVVAMNVVRGNGKRWGLADEALRLDFVDAHGRMADGSAKAKTPAISIDNAVYNIVYANQVDANFGGGVKMVRTAFFNIVGLNVVTDSNLGASDRFHFFGIELGAARADIAVADLDFAPSRGNVVFGNVVRGAHYAGIFIGEGSTDNEVFDNSIFGASPWAMEQARPQSNRSLNNLSNLPSRNIGAGLDPRLPELSRGTFD